MTIDTRMLTAALGRMARLLSLALLPALASEAEQNVLRTNATSIGQRKGSTSELQKTQPRNVPYLRAVSAPGLRFAEAEQPAAYDLEPTAYGVYHHDDYTQTPAPPVAKERPDIILPATQSKPSPTRDAETKSRGEEIAPILPDDLRRDVRPEDIMPFFQFPQGMNADIQTAPKPPGPPAQAPSSATYRQE